MRPGTKALLPPGMKYVPTSCPLLTSLQSSLVVPKKTPTRSCWVLGVRLRTIPAISMAS